MAISSLVYVSCFILAVTPNVESSLPNDSELHTARAYFDRWFGDADVFHGPGSLALPDEQINLSPDLWERTCSPPAEEPGKYKRTVSYRLRNHNLVIRYEGVLYTQYPVVEWTAYYSNDGSEDNPLIAQVYSIDATFTQFEGKATVLYRNKGDNCTADSYQPIEEPLHPGDSIHLANTGGRPTQTTFPYFNVNYGEGGLIVVVSWAGQWNCSFHRTPDGALKVTAGQEAPRFVLHPGETVRGPMIVLQFYEGSRRRSQNMWRRWMIAHNVPRPGGHLPAFPMLNACSSHQFNEMINANTESQIFFIDKYLERGFSLDHWWMDAGWYPCDGQWPKTGTWEVDETRFPGGFKPITRHAHERGVKIIVWFEPERVHAGTWLANTHPEWILGGAGGGLLNLGNPEARAWLTHHITQFITEQGIDLYRQDFNIDPLEFWRKNDAENRQGITEISHVEGYFAYWDALRRHHPTLLIDSCASGGRRNDLETLRRAVPFLRSDYIMEPIGNQCHTWALSEWFPFYGTGTSKTDSYDVLSVLCPEFTACWDQRQESIDWARLKTLIDQWREWGKNYVGDYYPLLPYSLEANCWIAWQWHRPEPNTGVVQVFRREHSDTETLRLPLEGINYDDTYTLTPLTAQSQAITATGAELREHGLPVTIPEKPGALVITYTPSFPQGQSVN